MPPKINALAERLKKNGLWEPGLIRMAIVGLERLSLRDLPASVAPPSPHRLIPTRRSRIQILQKAEKSRTGMMDFLFFCR
ncbi:MAG: hypothetical protein DRQ89_13865 [Epsilonproteobacteria bacterium]|nr:MAG: hypothetical protein DRQ89_13865 [Campylobacterota bacterium]